MLIGSINRITSEHICDPKSLASFVRLSNGSQVRPRGGQRPGGNILPLGYDSWTASDTGGRSKWTVGEAPVNDARQ